MKRILFAIAILFIAVSANSQILISLLLGDKLNSEGLEFGLIGGANLSSIDGLETNKIYPALNLGFYFDIRMKENWYLNTGVMVKYNMGVSELSVSDRQKLNVREADLNGNYDQVVSGFKVPVLIQYQFRNYIYVEAGPELTWLRKSFSKYTSNNDGMDVKIKDRNSDLLNWFNGAMAVGAGYQLLKGKGWDVGFRYSYAFTDVFKNIPGSKNQGFLVYVKIPVGAAKNTNENGQSESSN